MGEKTTGRWRKAFVNSTVLTLLQVLTIILRFVNQTFFIQVLGKEFLGLNGLFTNLLTYLSFAELGVGTSIVFSLYKPIYDRNYKKISALMNFIKRAYTGIGLAILVLGVGLIPLFPYIIKNYGDIEHIPIYFLLYLSNSVVSYFFTYKRSILIADQKEYKSSMNTFKYTLLQTILQIIVLYFFKAYSLYLIVATICTLISNLAISALVNREYPYLKENTKLRLSRFDIRQIRSNIIGMVGSRIGSIVVRSTDNLLLSAFMGLAIVGIYSNYLLIVTSVSTILSKLVSSVTASIGNLIAEKDATKSLFIYKTHFYINLVMTTITAACLLVALNPFVQAWAGKNYVLTSSTVIVIVLNYFIDQLRQSSIVFVSAYGLFVPNGKKSVVEALINFILSLILLTVFHLGIKGVLIGTILTNLLVNSWFEPLIIFQKGFVIKGQFKTFYLKTYFGNLVLMGGMIGALAWLILGIDTYLNWPALAIAIINVVLIVMFMIVIIIVIYHRQENLVYIKNTLLKRILKW
ncbi:lipopolysaccharide biosynthesis protein [Lactiplantibacillus plantarum]|uniref:lipopolysaccharide biosynthesis protein n=1 Tax=Lactiplantibacillus plantarum TaxID=1590 RepID=UPI0026517AA8|nr:oligosaccharide flippase family protein [Lactiplantibacillus plantarum]MDN7035343.1 transporter [Lactiplantibacillus plantarum]